MKKLLFLFVALIASTGIYAYDFKSGELYYSFTSDSTVEVTQGSGKYSGDIIIPSTVSYCDTCSSSFSVTSIGNGAFYNCSSLTSVTIPESVTSIGSYAFFYCSSLRIVYCNLIVPPTSSIFSYELTICLPNMTALKNYVVDPNWNQYNLVVSENFSDNIVVNVDQPGTLAYRILEKAEQWSEVYGLIITGTLNDEDMKYFARMEYLLSLDLSGTNIQNMYGCQNLKYLNKVILPASATTIDENAFNGCIALTNINLSNVTTIKKNAFTSSGLTNLHLPKVTSISDYAFSYCRNLSTLSLPVTTTIGNGSFQYCISLTNVHLPVVITIGNYAFADCISLCYVTMPLVTTIGNSAFSLVDLYYYEVYNLGLKELDLSNVTSLGNSAFCYCTGLEKVILSDELSFIPNYCFAQTSLKDINMPKALKEVGAYAFRATLFEEFIFPEGVTTIGNNVFFNTTLKSITLPSTLRSVSEQAFAGCGTLTDVYLYRVIPASNAMGLSKDITLHVPSVSLLDYKISDTWSYINNIVPIDSDAQLITNLFVDNKYTLYSFEGFSPKANFDLSVGAEFTLSVDTSITVGTFIQNIATISEYQYRNIYDEYGNILTEYRKYAPWNATFMNKSNIIADSVIVRLVPRSHRWNFFSLPFDVRMQDISIETMGSGTEGTSQWVIREYSGANRASSNGETWLNVPSDGVLKAHTGYILYWVVEDASSTDDNFYFYFNMPSADQASAQQMFANDNVVVPLKEYSSETAQNRSWNLVGNPYPCFFDIQQIDFSAPITVWDGEGYQAYSLLDDEYRLRPAEAFFVQAPQGVNTITFNKDGRSIENAEELTEDEYYNRNYAPRKSNVTSSPRQVFNFLIENTDYTDRTRIVINESASNVYDITCDAAKMISTNLLVPQIYVNNDGIHYAIDERPLGNGEYILGVHIGKTDTYTLQLQSKQNNCHVILVDTETDEVVNLSEGSYTFTANEGNYPERFHIAIHQKTPTDIASPEAIETKPYKTIENGQFIIVYPNGKKYTIGGIEL